MVLAVVSAWSLRIVASRQLLAAVRAGSEADVQRCLRWWADPNVTDEDEVPVVSRAAIMGASDIVLLLIRSGADVDKRGGQASATPLMFAAYTGQADLAGSLVEHGANVNAADAEGRTALFYAAGRGELGVARMLTARGAKVWQEDRAERTALWSAAFWGRACVVAFLLEAHDRPTTLQLRTALRAAVDRGHTPVEAIIKQALLRAESTSRDIEPAP